VAKGELAGASAGTDVAKGELAGASAGTDVAKGDRAGVELPPPLGFTAPLELEEALAAAVGSVATSTLKLVAVGPLPLLGFGVPPSFGGIDEPGAPAGTEVVVGGGIGVTSTGFGVDVAVRVDAGLDTGDVAEGGPKCS